MRTMSSQFDFECRSEVSEEGILEGYAAVFDQVSFVKNRFYERIERQAFDEVLARPDTDVRAHFNHDPNLVLGRQSAGTLELRTDEKGLKFKIKLPDTSYASDVKELVRRGDLTGASFRFDVGRQSVSRAPDGRRLRSIQSFKTLGEISVVPYPAYEGAGGLSLRSVESLEISNRERLIRARSAQLFIGEIQ